MSKDKEKITIKGNKDGLVFVLSERCSFDELLEEIHHKLEHTHQQILTGPLIHVTVKTGRRWFDEEEQQALREAIGQKGNLVVRSFEHTLPEPPPVPPKHKLKVIQGVVRSGQSVYEEENILFLGDVNPGGLLESTGNIFVMGSLRGMAHAGKEGREDAIIAASFLKPTQLRIASHISRPPDEWTSHDAMMEFAYMEEGTMHIGKLAQLNHIRPDLHELKGV